MMLSALERAPWWWANPKLKNMEGRGKVMIQATGWRVGGARGGICNERWNKLTMREVIMCCQWLTDVILQNCLWYAKRKEHFHWITESMIDSTHPFQVLLSYDQSLLTKRKDGMTKESKNVWWGAIKCLLCNVMLRSLWLTIIKTKGSTRSWHTNLCRSKKRKENSNHW